jgi:hypothetical protein
MTRVKKYEWGTFSASGASPQMVNPGNAALKQYTTTSSSTIPTGGLPLSGDISSLVSKGGPKVPAGGGFGKFMGNYGGAIAQAAGTLMPLLMKKPDPNEKPYKKGSKLIKYQEGNENLQATKLQKRIFENLDENSQRTFSNVEYLNRKTPNIKLSKETPAVFSPKMVNNLENKNFKQTTAELETLASREKYTPEEYPDIFTKEKKGKMGSAIKELELYKTRDVAEEARKSYEAKLKGTPFTDSLIKKSMSSQAFKDVTNIAGNKSFKDMTPAQQKQYRAGIASGKEFTVEGIKGKYAAVTKQQPQSAKMVTKGANKPLVKMKEDSWTKPQWQDFLNKRKQEEAQVNKEINYRKNPDLFWKDVQKLRQSTMGKNFDRGQKNQVVDKRKVYPEASPLAKYSSKNQKAFPSKPVTSIPSKEMDYIAQQASLNRKSGVAKNMQAYGMVPPFNPDGSINVNTPFFEVMHNTRFKKG